MLRNLVQDPEALAAEPVSDATLGMLPFHQQAAAFVIALGVLIVVLELVRKRKLREEYSLIWTGAALILCTLALFPNLLYVFQSAIGAELGTSALFFGALLFLMLVALNVSVHLTKLTLRNKALSQRLALLEREIEEVRNPRESRAGKRNEKSNGADGAA